MENRALERTVWSGFNCDRTDCQGKCVADPRKHVLAADYAAMEAERDELKRRCEAICNWIDNNNDNGAGEAIYAIAEGRDNG